VCFKKKKPVEIPAPFTFPVYYMHWDTLKALLESKGLRCQIEDGDKPDNYHYYTDLASWTVLFKDLIFLAENYALYERRDCDDYAKKASAEAAWKHGLGCLQVYGNTPDGRHAFGLVVVSETDVRIFDPNSVFECAGELLELNNKYGWAPDCWKP